LIAGRGASARAITAEDTAEGLKDAIRVDTAELRGHVDAVVRSSVEETLNALLQAEADQICKGGTLRALAGARRYARRQL
jgi:putative transposase